MCNDTLLEAVDASHSEMIDFIRELVAIPTENPPGKEYLRCAGVIAQRLKDIGLDPRVIEVPAGKRIRLEVSNEGKSAIEFESKDLKQEKVVPPGGKATVTINALKAGEYKFFDAPRRGNSIP